MPLHRRRRPSSRSRSETIRPMAHRSQGDEVTLDIHRGPEQIDSRSAKVGEDGKAVFENLPTGQGIAAVARVKHQNMAFRSRPVALDSARRRTLRRASRCLMFPPMHRQLSIGMHHLMVALRGTTLEFTEFMQLSNSSDRAVTGRERDDEDRPIVIRILLPEGLSRPGRVELPRTRGPRRDRGGVL